MKVSKVNHRRTAVALTKEANPTSGIIYAAPGKKGKTPAEKETPADVEEVLKELIRKSSALYSPFNNSRVRLPQDFKGDVKKAVKTANLVKKNYNNFVKKLVESNSDNKGDKIAITKPREGTYQTCQLGEKEADTVVNAVVDSCLRKSLKKEIKIETKDGQKRLRLPELVKKSIHIYILGEEELLAKDKDVNAEMHALFAYIIEDRYKIEQSKKIINSITKQKTKVCVNDVDGEKLLQLSVANTKKKALWDFVVGYANANKEEQDKMLRDIRKLIVLYVCGPSTWEKIKDNSDLDIWSFEKYEIPDTYFVSKDKWKKEIANEDGTTEAPREIFNEETLRRSNLDHYKKAEALFAKDDCVKFWLQHFENVIENLFSKKSKRTEDRIKSIYLCDYLWKDFFSYIATKYIDLGKGVYHFTVKDQLEKVAMGEEVSFGIVNDQFKDGISSFDYEKIKAEEELDRNIATYTTFAANTFARAVVKDEYLQVERHDERPNSDVLLYGKEKFIDNNVIRVDAEKRLLQYWGGQGRIGKDGELVQNGELYFAVRNSIYAIRNSSVHYTAKRVEENTPLDVNNPLNELFKKDYESLKETYASKYYSNNAWMFYKTPDISNLMALLYSDNEAVREAQIPSFNSIIKKNDMPDVISKAIKQKSYKKLKGVGEQEKYRSSLYFILKEVYYHAFITQEDLKNKFLYYLDIEPNGNDQNDKIKPENIKNKEAFNDFCKRINEVKSTCNSFGELCQVIMTDYNQQNQGRKTVESKKQQDSAKKKGLNRGYQHFPMLLHQVIKELFINYLKKHEELQFLREPTGENTEIALDEFVNRISDIQLCRSMKASVEDNSTLLNWYVLAHFLMPKQLNHLIGDIKNYIQYCVNVDKREASIRGDKAEDKSIDTATDLQKKINYYLDVIRVLEFAQLYVGRVSNNIEDYFKDEDEYAAFLSKFVNFNGETASELKNFCSKQKLEGEKSEAIGLYYDESNPIINRNVAYAKMYSNENILSNGYKRVLNTDITNLYGLKEKDLESYSESGVCKDRTEREKLSEYQQLKNHVELMDLSVFTDILNDLLAQMISWAYIRERDLMYFQLGIHYIRLFYNDGARLEDKFYELHGENINIVKGALLYQIAALYTHQIPMLAVDNDGNAIKAEKQGSTGACYKSFVDEYCIENNTNFSTYETGLCLFEDVNQHADIIRKRNKIAHAGYMASQDDSIMELISEIYNKFFVYDTKLKKSVSYIFKNILMRYCVVATLEFNHGSEDTLITVKKLISDQHTYKFPEQHVNLEKGSIIKKDNNRFSNQEEKSKLNPDGSIDIDVRNKDLFLCPLKAILEYKA